MTCEELIGYLSDYIDQNLDEDLMAAAREHLSTCHNCSVVLDSTQKTILLYREHGQRQRIPAERGSALYERIRAAFDAKNQDSENSL